MDDAPIDDLFRAMPGIKTRAAGDTENTGLPTLTGHFAVFDSWTEISSWFEGNFLERLAHGAFAKTIAEQRDRVKVLFDHGYDPTLGNKPLGPIEALEEDEVGARYEVPLIDTDYNRGFIVPAVEAGLLGSSFRFRAVIDEWNDDPGASEHNPKGLPERTIREVRLFEFGPVTFPAYPDGTTPQLRSLTDHYVERALGLDDLLSDEPLALRAAERFPRLRTLAGPREGTTRAASPATAPASDHATASLSFEERQRLLDMISAGVKR